jgi:hypothetical protein
MVFLPNPPEADKSLRLPCEMRSLFLWGYAQKITRHRTLASKSSEYYTYAGLSRHFNGAVIFFACLPSSLEGYAGHVILNKNPNLWMDTD